MNDTLSLGTSETVRHFVAAVAQRLDDLPREEREELVWGMEADLTDLVAERGPEALGDPVAYADELRAAAGLAPYSPTGADGRFAVGPLLDDVHRTWDRVLDGLPGHPRGFLESLAPIWWAARAWVGWMLLQELNGPSDVLVTPAWLALLVLLVVLSVQLGRGGWRLSWRRSGVARLLVVALNVGALLLVPAELSRAAWAVAESKAHHFASAPAPGAVSSIAALHPAG